MKRQKNSGDVQTKFELFLSKISDYFYNISVKLHSKKKNKGEKVGSMASNRKKQLVFYFSLVTLPIIHYLIFYVGVNINSILLAFKEYVGVNGVVYRPVGFANFERFFQEFFHGQMLKQMFANSLTFYFVGLIVGLPLALFFSFYIYKKYFLSEFFRVILFFPSIISSVVTAFMYLFMVDVGLVEIMAKFGVEMLPPLGEPEMRMPAVLFYNVMMSFGTNIIMYSSAMTRIPVSVVEYAAIDGVKPFREFISITIPLIFDTMSTFLIVGVTGIFTNQAHLYALFAKSAGIEVQTFGYYTFLLTNLGVTEIEFPYAATLGIIFTLILVPLTMLVRWLLAKINPDVQY